MEALAAIPGRFDRLLTCAQLSRTRSMRGSTARTIQWARTTVLYCLLMSKSNFDFTSGRTRRCVASRGGFGGHPRAVRPSPDMCSTIPYPQYARISRQVSRNLLKKDLILISGDMRSAKCRELLDSMGQYLRKMTVKTILK